MVFKPGVAGQNEPAWTDEKLRRLRVLWVTIDPETGKPTSTAKIGVMLHKSKNAVVGKSHRLDLPSRPSPIKRQDGTFRPKPAPAPARTLPPLPSEVVAAVAEPAPIIVPPPPEPEPDPVIIFRPPASNNPCVYPTGTTRIRFECEELALLGKPYCLVHAELCFVKIARRTPPSGDPRPWLENPK